MQWLPKLLTVVMVAGLAALAFLWLGWLPLVVMTAWTGLGILILRWFILTSPSARTRKVGSILLTIVMLSAVRPLLVLSSRKSLLPEDVWLGLLFGGMFGLMRWFTFKDEKYPRRQ